MIRTELHDLTHRIPGVPEHDDQANARPRPLPHGHQHEARTHRTHEPRRHHARERRVLVRWQRWIAALGEQRRGARD